MVFFLRLRTGLWLDKYPKKMKTIWKGSISFGLVNIPIKLYSAIEERGVKMRLLNKKDLSPIRYKRWSDKSGKEIAWEDIVKGVEVGEDEFIVISKAELEAMKPGGAKDVHIVEFVDAIQIDPIYFNSHYYIGPDKAKDKAFFLFREILEQTKKMAIGQFVMREKMYTCAIESYRQGLLLSTLNYGYEIKDISKIEELKEKPKISKQELALAKQLIDKITVKTFDINEFKDDFHESLMKIIKKKAKGQTIVIDKKEKPKVKEDLIAALKASLK